MSRSTLGRVHRRSRIWCLTLATVLVILAGCRGGGSDTKSISASTSGDTSSTVAVAVAVAKTIGCTGYTADDTTAPGAIESGYCTLHGKEVQLYRFTSRDAGQPIIDLAKTTALGIDPIWTGNVLLYCEDAEQVTEVKHLLRQ